ncbi:MAG: hypothetical protein UW27_C0001G0034 [Parcubacteria group bacterium GW2011_GWA1_44_13]|uniref:SHS2 domain-containing protein n=1 Tax=Candidatus Nomurabacteria bacterium GW2011_GWB1_44_12 TaxID=1618748 RepID=A0A837IC01_9BACT|nr:MAG: hypothetical protein UW25_C0001G0035 [Candidatus Nomurabacteria bacterium GW2011_GWB1_44_12]KKT38538.1 MAG: hypothetical protein UW27_C0001G0034 [Parcubacteria group bacterium GW2011_GWA1_44_13]KKT60938.1 MAG: hypothetical protein UW54_C0001G0019 [Parcubacteria group bacterium GW2011_GWC1_44_26]HBB44464.1 hypothetical protein [Candidatus Yonathbacteria bacterium]
MAFSLFGGQKQNEALTLLVDIGSASVGAALIKIEKGQTPQIVSSIREDISFQEVLSSARFLLAMNKALDKVLKDLQEKTKTTGNPKHFFCTLSSPWFILKTRDLKIVKNDEFEVTERAIEKFIDEDILKLKDELKETLPPDDVRIIEKKVIHIKLNGYEIKNPYKQKTSRMEMTVTVGVSSGKVIQSIERKINNFFHAKSVHFGAFPVAAFSAIRDIFPTENNFLFLDITGEATDVSRVENDLLTRTVSFPRGKNFFIREISARLRTVHEEATTLFSMFLRGELDTVRYAEVSKIVETAEAEWLQRFEKAITVLAENGAPPRKIFFTADAEISSRLLLLISKAKSDLLADAEFEVQYLDQLIVSKFVSFDTEVIRDPFIVVEALLAEKLLEQHT